MEIPDFHAAPDFFAQVIAKVKQGMNRKAPVTDEMKEELERLRLDLMSLETGKDFSDAARHFAKSPDEHKRLLHQIAVSKGFVWIKNKYARAEDHDQTVSNQN